MIDDSSARRFIVENQTRGSVLAENVILADTPQSRRIGLLSRSGLNNGEGLWIIPCQAVHTFWMKFSIDVLFLDHKLKVKRLYRQLPPFRLTRFVWGTRSVLEVAAGMIDESKTEQGDVLRISPLVR